MSARRVRRYVDDLLRGRRPSPFAADAAEVTELRLAMDLLAARAPEPDPAFVEALHRRLASGPAADVPRTARRRVLQVGSAAAAAGVAAGAALDHLLAGAAMVAAEPGPTEGRWRTVATTADLPEGTVRPFEAGGVRAFVERRDGRLRAVSGVCTHQGCRLVLVAAQQELTCPCHDAAFALDGTLRRHQLSKPPAALPAVEVRQVGDDVQILGT